MGTVYMLYCLLVGHHPRGKLRAEYPSGDLYVAPWCQRCEMWINDD